MPERARVVVLAAIALAIAQPAAAAPTASFNASRTERCSAPCAVLFDATATTDSSVEAPFHALDYRWNFGDEHGEVWELSGQPKNRAVGGVAGHLFTRPGSFDVTLAVTNPAGQRASAKKTITVDDPDAAFARERTTCVSVAGDFTGCPAGAQHVTSSDFGGSLANGDGHRTLFRRGEKFHLGSRLVLVRAAERGAAIDVFGAGNARAEVAAAGQATIDPADDWRVSHLLLRGPGPGNQAAAFTENDGVRRFTVNDVEVRGFNACATFWSPKQIDTQIAFVDIRCTEFPDPGTGTKFYEDMQESMVLGLDLDKGDHKDPRDQTEFAYRTVFSVKKVIEHSRFRGRAPNMSKNLLQLRHCPTEGPWLARCPDGKVPSRFVIVADNQFVEGGGPHAITVIRVCDHGSCTGSPGASQRVEDYIFERNLFQLDVRDVASETLGSVFMLQASRTTIRNNVADLQGWPRGGPKRAVFVLVDTPSNLPRDRGEDIWIVNNTVYLGDAFPGGVVLCGAPHGGPKHACVNNLLYAPHLGGPRAAAFGPGWTDLGNLLVTESSPFAGPPPAKGKATLRQLGGFRLGASVPHDAGQPFASGNDGFAADDAFGGCRHGATKPDVGAHQRGVKACDPGAASAAR